MFLVYIDIIIHQASYSPFILAASRIPRPIHPHQICGFNDFDELFCEFHGLRCDSLQPSSRGLEKAEPGPQPRQAIQRARAWASLPARLDKAQPLLSRMYVGGPGSVRRLSPKLDISTAVWTSAYSTHLKLDCWPETKSKSSLLNSGYK